MTEEKKELSVKSIIRDLLTQDSKLSVARQIELAFDDVVKAQDMGFTDAQIVEALGENGIEVKLMNFRVIMSRIRRARGKAKKSAKKSPSAHPGQRTPAGAVSERGLGAAPTSTMPVAAKVHTPPRTFERNLDIDPSELI